MPTLTQAQADTLRDVCYNLKEARPVAYSGRAMFGAQCLGIILANTQEAYVLGLEIQKDDEDLASLLADQPARTDSMGRDSIVLYWEGVKVEGTDLSDDDGVDDEE